MFENPKRGRQARNFTTNVPCQPWMKATRSLSFCLVRRAKRARHANEHARDKSEEKESARSLWIRIVAVVSLLILVPWAYTTSRNFVRSFRTAYKRRGLYNGTSI